MKKNIYLFLVLFGVGGCATMSDELSLKKIKPKERIYVGRVKVNFNKEAKPKCELYIGLDLAPSIKLSEDGSVFYRTDRKEPRFGRLACYHQPERNYAAWHHQSLPLMELSRSESSEEVTYFGDIAVDWKIDPDATLEAAQKEAETAIRPKVGTVKDSGEIKVKVTTDLAGSEKEFYNRYPDAKELGLKVREALVGVKK